MTCLRPLLLVAGLLLALGARAEALTVAAASDLKFAMDELVAEFGRMEAGRPVEVVYGSSGKFHAQIRQGAPYDLFFSADIAYARELAEAGFAASEVRPYARGRLAIWSAGLDASGLRLEDLTAATFRRIAIANPRHAPYGSRAVEALRAAGVLERLEGRLVFGENVAQAAHFVRTGAAEVGVIALSLALSPELAALGGHALVPETLHLPLEQGFIVTRRAADKALAWRFADYVVSAPAQAVLARYGFMPPGAPVED